jgi:uncharacterized protein DUF29
MSAKSPTVPVARLYDEDFLAWTEETVRLLRARRFDCVDLEALIEEVDGMGISQRHQLGNRLVVILKHLLKWKHQTGKRSNSWRSTLVTQRLRVHRLLRDSPSLRSGISALIGSAYDDAVKEAEVETGLPKENFPAECPFTVDQILDPDYLP